MPLVVDASVAIKWVVPETLAAEAAALRNQALLAPDLWLAECANILWKKARSGQMALEAIPLAIQVIASARVRLEPTLHLFEAATNLALELDHPAYDCFYLALAAATDSPLVTADDRLTRKISGSAIGKQIELVPLGDAERLSSLLGGQPL